MTREEVAEAWFHEDYVPVTQMMREAGLRGRGSETEAYARVSACDTYCCEPTTGTTM